MANYLQTQTQEQAHKTIAAREVIVLIVEAIYFAFIISPYVLMICVGLELSEALQVSGILMLAGGNLGNILFLGFPSLDIDPVNEYTGFMSRASGIVASAGILALVSSYALTHWL